VAVTKAAAGWAVAEGWGAVAKAAEGWVAVG
jgi:hypothetical protein